MKKIISLFFLSCVLTSLISTPSALAQPQAICVPWEPAVPEKPHYTYSGAEITLKGIARGDATEYRWDYGDGDGTTWATITDPYNLGVKHTYTGMIGKLFIAKLYVRDALANEVHDLYRIKIYEGLDISDPNQLDVRRYMAIDEGLWWLHTTMIRGTFDPVEPGYEQPYGYWDDPSGSNVYRLPATGASLNAFQQHGSMANGDYEGDPYVETVQRALNTLFYHTYKYDISVQPAGDPDTNGNGIGIVTNHSSSIGDNRQTYIGGICAIALASSGAPEREARVGRDGIYGRSYKDIVQDMVDFFAFGQIDSGTGRGGWRYFANYSDADMSTTQWPPLAMMAAEIPTPTGMGATVPQFVRDELPLFLDYTQYTACDNNNGGFGYNNSTYILNVLKAAAGVICHEFLNTPLTDAKVQSALGFMYRHWNDTGAEWLYQRLHGNSYGMYAVMKAMRIPGELAFYNKEEMEVITDYDCTIPGQTNQSFDWFYSPDTEPRQGLGHYVVTTQQADGSWDDVLPALNPVYDAFATGWRILILQDVFVLKPISIICDCEDQEYEPNQDIHLNGSCSTHRDPSRHIVSYEWDFDCDGGIDATGPEATIVGGYPVEGYYTVCLKVSDDTPEFPLSDTDDCLIYVHPPPHPPHPAAHPDPANKLYEGWPYVPITLDASTSWDPNGDELIFEWDLDNDGLFGEGDDDCFGEPADAVGMNPEWTWYAPYGPAPIGLKVTDIPSEPFEPVETFDLDTEVHIGNHSPVSDPGGPYGAFPGSTITLDGTGSFDIDPGDDVEIYEWDLDKDGEFDDCTGDECPFTVGLVLGTVYDVCLKVTDSYEDYTIACTTVKIQDEDTDEDGIPEISDNCPNHPNGPSKGTCTIFNIVTGNWNVSIGQFCTVDGDCDPGEFCEKVQADNYPPGGNNIGDACDCEADFNCDRNVDGGDVELFLAYFGRSRYINPCSNDLPCNGDFNCDVNVDGGDIEKFLEDFGRSQYFNPCPACEVGDWCVYP